MSPIKKRMDPNRFVIGEHVQYVNHVTGENLGALEVVAIDGDFVMAKRMFYHRDPFKFRSDGRATWSTNLSIQHAADHWPTAPRVAASDSGGKGEE